MIKSNEPLSMVEVIEYLKKGKDSETDVKGFIKKFVKLNPKDAKELRKKIGELKLMKVNERDIVKIIDLMPENAEELNKIFTDVGLNEDETNKILETVKEFK
jgi:DNA-directed RNA polymerase subunit F